jgi:hypothetical protein
MPSSLHLSWLSRNFLKFQSTWSDVTIEFLPGMLWYLSKFQATDRRNGIWFEFVIKFHYSFLAEIILFWKKVRRANISSSIKKVQHFMACECLLSSSEQPATGPYPQPFKSTPKSYPFFFSLFQWERYFYIQPSKLCLLFRCSDNNL